jgi:hypothetical protein
MISYSKSKHVFSTLEQCHNYIRSNLIENLSSKCFLENSSAAFSLPTHTMPHGNYDMMMTSSGQCLQLIDYQLSLTLLNHPTYAYRLQANSIDGARSSYYIESLPSLMSITLLNDENHVIVRFLRFSSTTTRQSQLMLANHSSASNYYYEQQQQIIQLSSTSMNYTSPLMIKCSGPCCYSRTFEHFAFNINNDLYVYDMKTFQATIALRVPIRRVTLSDMKFSIENPNLIYTTNGQQFQQWDIRQSNRSCSLRLPILCSTIKCLTTKSNCILVSSFDERINLIDLRMPTKHLLIYNASTSSSNNPHFSFSIDHETEDFLAACSQNHIVNVWDLNSARLLNRFQCPVPQRFVHTTTKCSITCVDRVPILGIHHPEYCRFTARF